MRFTSDQHTEMAERLDERAKQNPDPEKAKKQAAMANTFRLLARRAAKQGREIGVRVETGHKPTQKEPSGYPKPSLIRLELSLSPNDGFCGPDRTREHGGGSVPA